MHKGVWITGAGDIGGHADPCWTWSTTKSDLFDALATKVRPAVKPQRFPETLQSARVMHLRLQLL